MAKYIPNRAIQFTDSATAEKFENQCTYIDLSDRKNIIRNNTAYTSHGKRKARPDDPIRTIKEVQAAKQYFLNNGRTEIGRLRNHMLFVLGISTGLRGGDLLNLRIKDVLSSDGEINNYIVLVEEKTSKNNDPYLNSEAKNAIKMYLRGLNGKFNMTDYLIPSNRGTKMTTSQLYVILSKLNTDLKLPYHIGAHTMRKTFAYWTVQMHKGDSNILIALQGMMNHSSPYVTLRYAGITKDEEDNLYDDIASLFTMK